MLKILLHGNHFLDFVVIFYNEMVTEQVENTIARAAQNVFYDVQEVPRYINIVLMFRVSNLDNRELTTQHHCFF